MPLLNLSFGNLTQPLGRGTNPFPNQPSNSYSFGNLTQPMGSGATPYINSFNPYSAMMGTSSTPNLTFNSNPVGNMPASGVTPSDTYRRQLLLQQLQQQNANLQPTQYYTAAPRQVAAPAAPQYSAWQDYIPLGNENHKDWVDRMVSNQKAAGVYREQKAKYTPEEQDAYRQQLEKAGVLTQGNFQDIFNSRIQHGLPGYLDPMMPVSSSANKNKYGSKLNLWNLQYLPRDTI